MNFEALHRTVAALAVEQKLNRVGRVSCATFLRTGTCERGTACTQAHYPPFRVNVLVGSDANVLAEYITFLTNVSKHPQFRVKKVPVSSLILAFREALNCIKMYADGCRWRQNSYGEVFVLVQDTLLIFSQTIAKFAKELASGVRKQKIVNDLATNSVSLLLQDILNAVHRLTATWLKEEGSKALLADDCALNDCNSLSSKGLTAIIEAQANGLFKELSDTSKARREIIELLSTEFHKSVYLAGCARGAGGASTQLTLMPFGSTCSGFGYGPSDLDLVLLVGAEYHSAISDYASLVDYHRLQRATTGKSVSLSSNKDQNGVVDGLRVLEACLEAALACGQFELNALVDGARVPVLKLRHIVHDIEVDICVNNAYPLYNTQLLRQYALVDRRVRYLAFAVKLWTKRRGISDPHNSSFSSYTWVLLVVYFLQQYRRAGSEPMLSFIPAAGIKAELIGESLLAQVFDSLVINDSSPGCDDALGNVASLLAQFFAFYATESVTGFRGSRNTLVFDAPLYDNDRLRLAPVKACARGNKEKELIRGSHRAAKSKFKDNVTTVADQMSAVSLCDANDEDSSDGSGSDADDDLVGLGAVDKAAPLATASANATSDSNRLRNCVVADNAMVPWRFAIEDPLDLHDLAQVVYNRAGQQNLLTELRRGYDVLLGSGSGEDMWSLFSEKKLDFPVFPYLCRHCSGEHSSHECPVFACFICHKPGHFGRDCPRKVNKASRRSGGMVGRAGAGGGGGDSGKASAPRVSNQQQSQAVKVVSKDSAAAQGQQSKGQHPKARSQGRTNTVPVPVAGVVPSHGGNEPQTKTNQKQKQQQNQHQKLEVKRLGPENGNTVVDGKQSQSKSTRPRPKPQPKQPARAKSDIISQQTHDQHKKTAGGGKGGQDMSQPKPERIQAAPVTTSVSVEPCRGSPTGASLESRIAQPLQAKR